MWTHLIKVPLAVRAAGPTDIPALLRLQDASLSKLRVRPTTLRLSAMLATRLGRRGALESLEGGGLMSVHRARAHHVPCVLWPRGCARQVAAPAAELAQCVAGAAPRSFVAVYEGAIIAALLARPDTQARQAPA